MMSHSSSSTLIGATLGGYRLEELVGKSELGPLFAARGSSDGSQTRYLVRILAVQVAVTPQALASFGDRWQREAGRIATLQHPYILPLVDYGVASGMLYVVSPYVPVRSLSARLAQHGPVDALTVGRYLDQIAAALEYAHERATIHCNLSTDCVYLQPDGHVVVADLGVRHLIDLSAVNGQSYPLLGNTEACAPEQLRGGHLDTYTDVYALGAVLYRLLSGHPIFMGNTFDEVLQQHLMSPVPPLSKSQPGLPVGLDALIAVAMAKELDNRFRHPGAMANAYHEIVAPNRQTRVPFISPEAPSADPARRGSLPHVSAGPAIGQAGDPQAEVGRVARAAPSAIVASGASDRPGFLPSHTRSLARTGRNLLLAALLLVVVSGTAYTLSALNGGFGGSLRPSGSVLFSDNPGAPPGHSDAATIVVHNLGAPPNGYLYDAWLLDSGSEHTTPLGTLLAKGNTYALTDPGDAADGMAGSNLLVLGDRFEITLEYGHIQLPVGKVLLAATFPAKSFAHVRHLLVGFPTTPGHVGLLVGLLDQARALNTQALDLQSAVTSGNTIAVQCDAQTIMDIIEGAQGAHYQPLPSACAARNITSTADGYGLLGAKGYLTETAQHASYAATAPDATNSMQTQASYVETATTTINGWTSTLDQDALTLLRSPTNAALAAEVAGLADHVYRGAGTNGDKQADPDPGKAGALDVYIHGQLMATLTLAPPA